MRSMILGLVVVDVAICAWIVVGLVVVAWCIIDAPGVVIDFCALSVRSVGYHCRL